MSIQIRQLAARVGDKGSRESNDYNFGSLYPTDRRVAASALPGSTCGVPSKYGLSGTGF